VIVVTTFSWKNFEQYAEECLSTWHYLPCPKICYVEGGELSHRDFEVRDLDKVSGRKEFLAKCPPVDHSIQNSFLYDAGKFCHKAFAQMDAMKKDGGEILYFDSDVKFHAPVNKYFLKGLLKDVSVCYLGRESYTETGFIGFDCNHRDLRRLFLPRYESLYRGGLLELPYQTDCHAFDHARQGVAGRDIGSGASSEHIWCRSPLAEFSDHLKGNRKNLGYSPEHPSSNPVQAVVMS